MVGCNKKMRKGSFFYFCFCFFWGGGGEGCIDDVE